MKGVRRLPAPRFGVLSLYGCCSNQASTWSLVKYDLNAHSQQLVCPALHFRSSVDSGRRTFCLLNSCTPQAAKVISSRLVSASGVRAPEALVLGPTPPVVAAVSREVEAAAPLSVAFGLVAVFAVGFVSVFASAHDTAECKV
jgi:hypothetical protein